MRWYKILGVAALLPTVLGLSSAPAWADFHPIKACVAHYDQKEKLWSPFMRVSGYEFDGYDLEDFLMHNRLGGISPDEDGTYFVMHLGDYGHVILDIDYKSPDRQMIETRDQKGRHWKLQYGWEDCRY